MAAGSFGAHALGLALAGSHDESLSERGSEPAGLLGLLPVVAGITLALALVALLVSVRGGRRRGVSAAWFFVLPPVAWALQELAERLIHAEAFPFSTVTEPKFLLGLLLQVPFGLLALVVALLLRRVAVELGRIMGGGDRLLAAVRGPELSFPPSRLALPLYPVLASGRSERGPPAVLLG
jgi:hypothetical protein